MSFFSKITKFLASSSNEEARAPDNALVARANPLGSFSRGAELVVADEEISSSKMKEPTGASASVEEHDEMYEVFEQQDDFQLPDSVHCSHGRGRDRKRNSRSKKRTQFLRNARRMKTAEYYGGASA